MDYFRKYLGGQQDGVAPSGAETVERLCDRVQSSTLLEDRRDAVRALKSLSKKFRLEVGTQGMEVLLHVLEMDRNDTEITGYALETLCNVMSSDPGEEGEELPPEVAEGLGMQFTEMFVRKADNVSLLLSLLEEYDFHVRWPTVRLLTLLLSNKGKDLQEAILVSPMGVSKLMDLLLDSREIIRNDGLLLLIQLTKGNASIQKIVAFEGAFERLLDIIPEEGNSDGGIVVEDCLLLLLNLLKNNSSNQNFFKEGSFIQRLPPYFELQPADQSPQGGWSAQKVTNIHLMLQVVRCLVTPNNPTAATTACQKVMNQCTLLQQLSVILMASGVPADVLTETINTVSEVIRGNADNQEYFASVMAPSNPPRPAIVVLLMSMVNEKQPFVLRCAVLYCFQSFLYKNELGQSQIIQTLLPSTADANSISAGQLLCGGLFSADSLSTWFAATALLHAIVDNATQKEQLLRVQLATSLGNPPVSLLQQCSNILAQGGKFQTRIGLLMLLCHWMAHSTIATTHFLHHAANVPFLISQVSASESDEQESLVQGLCAFMLGICVCFNSDQVESYTRAHLRQVIEKRIGIERFTDKLSQVTKHESYSHAAKRPQLNYKQSTDVIFDFEFTRLFKSLETEVIKSLSPDQDKERAGRGVDQHDSIVAQYKELIREQDAQLNSVKAELSAFQTKNSETEAHTAEMNNQIQQLRDQNALFKAQRGSSLPPSESNDVDYHKKEIEEKVQEIEKLKADLTMAEAKVLASHSGMNGEAEPESSAVLQATTNRLQGEVNELHHKLEQQKEEVRLYKNKYEDACKQLTLANEKAASSSGEDTSTNSVLLAERNTLSSQISEQEAKIHSLQEDKTTLSMENASLKSQLEALSKKVKDLETELSSSQESQLTVTEESERVKKEQEELLVLLADQDTKLKSYQERLKTHGEQVTDDEEDDFEDEEDGDEDGLDD